jgi:hypothetical protein
MVVIMKSMQMSGGLDSTAGHLWLINFLDFTACILDDIILCNFCLLTECIIVRIIPWHINQDSQALYLGQLGVMEQILPQHMTMGLDFRIYHESRTGDNHIVHLS